MTFLTVNDCDVANCGTLSKPTITMTTQATFTLPIEDYILIVYLLLMFFLSCVINGMTFYVFRKKSSLHTVSNSFVLNLICAETVLTILLAVFSVTSVIFGTWVFNEICCRVQGYFLMVILVSIHYSLMIIALDRKIAINNSLRYADIFNQTLGATMISVTWCLGCILGTPVLLGWSKFKYNASLFVCTFDPVTDSSYSVVFLIWVFIVPLLVECVCYICVFRAALSHTRQARKVWPVQSSTTTTLVTTTTSGHQESSGEDQESEANKTHSVAVPPRSSPDRKRVRFKTVKTILFIAFTYVIFWFPFFSVIVLQTANVFVSKAVGQFTVAMLMTSGVAKTIVYAFMNRTTRCELIKCLQICLPKLFKPTTTPQHDMIISTITGYPSTSCNGSNTTGSQPTQNVFQVIRSAPMTSDMRPISEETDLDVCKKTTLFKIHPYSFNERHQISQVDVGWKKPTRRITCHNMRSFEHDNEKLEKHNKLEVKPMNRE